jgi:hypothetical protein
MGNESHQNPDNGSDVQWHADLHEPLAHLLAWVDFIESGDRESFKT